MSFACVRNRSGGYPPGDAGGLLGVLEPLLSSPQISNVPALVDEVLQVLEILPDRVVDDEKRVIYSVYLHVTGGLAVFVRETPHKSW